MDIALTKGQVAIVDGEDYEWLSKWKWHAILSHSGYRAMRSCRCSLTGKHRGVLMHRQIVACLHGLQVDHINNNTLDNRRENLRVCNSRQNHQNRKKGYGTSKYKGVLLPPKYKSYKARITADGKIIELGYHKNEIDAAKAYDRAAIEYFGEFANTNFPKENYNVVS